MPSAVIRSFNYDPQRRHLHVIFQTGRHYIYEDVPEQTFRQMKLSFSKGEFFNQHIRDRYAFSRTDDE